MYRKLLIIIAILLFPWFGMAQNIAVSDFYLAANDQTANSHGTMAYDQNGEVCAIIKVETTQKGFGFEVGSLGVVKVDESQVGEVWVYVPHGVKRITIKHAQLGVIRDYAIPVAIEKARTYIMKLTTGTVQTIVQQAVTQQYVVFQVTPKDAMVTLDNQVLTVTDGTAMAYKDFGTYDYRVERNSYHPEVGKITVNDPENKVKKKVELAPAFGWIEVGGESAKGAQLYIDKSQQGTIPLSPIQIASGQHSVSLVKPLYKSFETTVTVRDNETTRLTPMLEPDFAHLTLSAGEGVEIWVNGAKRGTGHVTDDFSTGSYLVETKLAHHRNGSQSIRIDPSMKGQMLQLPSPMPIYGSLDITTTPALASVSIDGKSRGETPIRINNILEGPHTITLSLNGYGTETREVSIAEGQTSSVSVAMQNGREVTITSQESGAHIFIDGKDMGVSPFSGSLTFGEHTAYAALNGIESEPKTISVSQGTGALPQVIISFFEKHTFTVNGVRFTMVAVEGGTFAMGATSEQGSEPYSDEKPAHRVTLSNYYIGETEVTQALWKAVMGNNPSYYKGDNLPVEKVSWNDCQTFITKLNQLTGKKFRLPTEAEWEYAARGGSKSKGYKYSGSNTIDNVAWYTGNSNKQTHPVAQKQANELGLYDMSGNVWEWCQDWYGSYSSSPQTNPQGANSGSDRVGRGGSWCTIAKLCRVSGRIDYSPADCHSYIGLRLALSE